MDNNRQIKFRALDKFNGCYHYSKSGDFADLAQFFQMLDEYERGGNEIIPERFSGLTDKEGNEIYEGDVLEFELEDLGKERGVVRFSKDGFWTSQAEGASEGLLSDELKFYKGKVKIVGTIHQ